MDFFQAQENARRTSRWLVLWFMLCVLGVILAIHVVMVPILRLVVETNVQSIDGGQISLFNPKLFFSIAAVTSILIVGGSLYKLSALSKGGAVVARDLGARELDQETGDFHERRLLNVVEEMAISSGTPMPGVWVMDGEQSINAFAAGTDPANAVIGVTKGTMQRLNREELQGVVAHEFSHILNGDMRLNMRLTGWIFGLLMLVILGRGVLGILRYSGGTRRTWGGGRGGGRGGGAGILIIILIGAALWAVGSIGAFFSRWLQAAVSRQREFLADASAVQFTRNPEGIANALRKIGGANNHSAIHAAAASEARHLFFARSDTMGFAMATHPPLDKRIKAVFPHWDGTMLKAPPPERPQPDQEKNHAGKGFPGMPPPLPIPDFGEPGFNEMFNPAFLGAYAEGLRQENPDRIRSIDAAKALIHGLLLPADEDLQPRGVETITRHENAGIAESARHWHEKLHTDSSAAKLIRVDQSLPWLRKMDHNAANAFITTNRALIELDGQVNLFEFMIEQVIDRNVAIATGLRKPPPMRHRNLASVEREVAVLVGIFTRIGGGEEPDAEARSEYRQHTRRDLPRLPPDACTLVAAAEALPELDASTPLVKSRVLRLCRLVATADGVLEDHETELLRAVSDAIGAPAPRVRHDNPAA